MTRTIFPLVTLGLIVMFLFATNASRNTAGGEVLSEELGGAEVRLATARGSIEE